MTLLCQQWPSHIHITIVLFEKIVARIIQCCIRYCIRYCIEVVTGLTFIHVIPLSESKGGVELEIYINYNHYDDT